MVQTVPYGTGSVKPRIQARLGIWKPLKSGFEYFRGDLTGIPNIFESQVLLATSGGENRLQNIKHASYCHYLHPDTNEFTTFDKRTELIIEKGRTFASEIINDEWLNRIFSLSCRDNETSANYPVEE